MRVRIFDYAADGTEVERTVCDLSECIPEIGDEYHAAVNQLQTVGRVWIGGGAAPLALLMVVT